MCDVAEMVGCVVDGVSDQCGECKLLCSLDVTVAKQKGVKVGICVRVQVALLSD